MHFVLKRHTEINDDIFVVFYNRFQEFIRQLLDGVRIFLLHQPGEDLFFLAQITFNILK